MKKTILTLALGLMLSGQGAFALTADEVVTDLQAQGYTRTEVRVGPTQIKVEAIRGTEKLEVIYDKATGAVLKTEMDQVRLGENISPGVSVRDRNRDFVRVVVRSRSSDDDSSDDSSSNRRSSSSDDNGRSSSSDDNRRSSSSDDNGRSSSSDDNGGDRRSGGSSSSSSSADDSDHGRGRGSDDDHDDDRDDDSDDDNGGDDS